MTASSRKRRILNFGIWIQKAWAPDLESTLPDEKGPTNNVGLSQALVCERLPLNAPKTNETGSVYVPVVVGLNFQLALTNRAAALANMGDRKRPPHRPRFRSEL